MRTLVCVVSLLLFAVPSFGDSQYELTAEEGRIAARIADQYDAREFQLIRTLSMDLGEETLQETQITLVDEFGHYGESTSEENHLAEIVLSRLEMDQYPELEDQYITMIFKKSRCEGRRCWVVNHRQD